MENNEMKPLTRVRIATVNYPQYQVDSWEDFVSRVSYWVHVAAEYEADFICFPEFLTLQLLSMQKKKIVGKKAVEALAPYTQPFLDLLKELALSHKINIIGGTHLAQRDDGEVENVAHVFLRDGSHFKRGKVHITPSERRAWGVVGWSDAEAIPTEFGPIGIQICYDSEFPEMSRRLIDQGVRMIFVPFCTDDEQGYMRVRHCSQARAIENQCYLVLSGNVGQLKGVFNMDGQYAQSCILTPCDLGFPRRGVAAEATANIESMVVSDLRLDEIDHVRERGTVRNIADSRPDLYQNWHKKS